MKGTNFRDEKKNLAEFYFYFQIRSTQSKKNFEYRQRHNCLLTTSAGYFKASFLIS
jgi:hypothetical protein